METFGSNKTKHGSEKKFIKMCRNFQENNAKAKDIFTDADFSTMYQ